jgi:hypothetical protein
MELWLSQNPPARVDYYPESVHKSIVQHVYWYNFTPSYGIVESKPANQYKKLSVYGMLDISLLQLTLISMRVSAPSCYVATSSNIQCFLSLVSTRVE